MAGTSLLALIDDIAALLDDVAILSKVAAKKAAGVLGDDLALNAQQMLGIRAERELPVVWAVARGSFKNKLVLVPAALLISALAPWAITPLLMLGGAFLCFEGAEKLAHRLTPQSTPEQTAEAAHHLRHLRALADPDVDIAQFERDKIRGAIRTDFILSAEIIVIALGTVAALPFATQVWVLAVVAVAMTAGVYGLVAAIVKLDDAGLALHRVEGEALRARAARAAGLGLLRSAPLLMKGLSIAGTVAMFLVGGSILLHGVPTLAHFIESALAPFGPILAAGLGMVVEGLAGVAAGGLIVLVTKVVKGLRGQAS